MGFKFNPLIYSGLDISGSAQGSPFFGNPVDTVGDLPPTGADGEMRVVKDTDSIYIFDADTNTWKLVTDPLTDIRQVSFTVPQSTTFADTGLSFDPAVESFTAMVNVDKSGVKETITLIGTKTSGGVQRTMQMTGESTTIDFLVVDDAGALKIQYNTDAAPATYELTFRAITLT